MKCRFLFFRGAAAAGVIFGRMLPLETRLWATAAQTAREAGLEYSLPCSRNLRDLVRSGVAVMRRSGRTGEDDLDLASLHLGKVAAEMVRVTRTLDPRSAEGGPQRIRETALVQAKGLLPLWPFG